MSLIQTIENVMARGALWQPLCIPIVFIAPLFLVLVVLGRHRRVWRKEHEAPFDELKRRPPGESLRLRLETLDEKINDEAMMLVSFPALLSICAVGVRMPNPVFYLGGFLLSAIWAGIFGSRFYRMTRKRADFQLGFDGERFVGEELNRLIAEGFEVYHDLPFDGFNVDHVLVGAAGVFVVETKTRRKRRYKSGAKQYRVEFDGACLYWPWGTDAGVVEQAINNARTVGRWLSGAVGEAVVATPILTVPGWMVERRTRNIAVHVINPKEIMKVCNSSRPQLDEKLVRRICYQLDQKRKLGLT